MLKGMSRERTSASCKQTSLGAKETLAHLVAKRGRRVRESHHGRPASNQTEESRSEKVKRFVTNENEPRHGTSRDDGPAKPHGLVRLQATLDSDRGHRSSKPNHRMSGSTLCLRQLSNAASATVRCSHRTRAHAEAVQNLSGATENKDAKWERTACPN
jgi:hypothetical protein